MNPSCVSYKMKSLIALATVLFFSLTASANESLWPFADRCAQVVKKNVRPPFWEWGRDYSHMCEDAITTELGMQCVELSTRESHNFRPILETCAKYTQESQIVCMLWKRVGQIKWDIDPNECLTTDTKEQE